jgi:hypothetical protein
MGREIQLNGEQKVVVITREETAISTDKISIDSITDDGEKVIARLSFFSSTGITRLLVLWEDQDYINIGQWTDTDVDIKIKQLLNIV